MIQITSQSEQETSRLGARFARRLRGGDVVALTGPLGAGKTCFVRGIAAGLGLDPRQVSSPTFILCQEYEPAGEQAVPTIAHIDAYRIGAVDELESIGFDELLADDRVIVVIEWADRIEAALPESHLAVQLEHVSAEARRISISASRTLADRITEFEDSRSARANCPTCGRAVDERSEVFPFCSSRCRLADLGAWFGGQYRISRELTAEDE